MATGFSVIQSQRDKNKLVSEGYIYKVDRVRGEKSYWECHLPDCKTALKSKMLELGLTVDLEIFRFDFETASHKSAKEVFPGTP